MAKAPVAGRAKTRLACQVGNVAAAELAAAALLDTLLACEEAFSADVRVIAISGDLSRAANLAALRSRLRGWRVIGQRGMGFGHRLCAAHHDASRLLCRPIVQIGMDTPQIESADLASVVAQLDEGRTDAVLGPADDGGWWVLGLREPARAKLLVDVPMSTEWTAQHTQRLLERDGAIVKGAARLRDVDTAADAEAVSLAAPDTRFARAWRTHAGSAASRFGMESPC